MAREHYGLDDPYRRERLEKMERWGGIPEPQFKKRAFPSRLASGLGDRRWRHLLLMVASSVFFFKKLHLSGPRTTTCGLEQWEHDAPTSELLMNAFRGGTCPFSEEERETRTLRVPWVYKREGCLGIKFELSFFLNELFLTFIIWKLVILCITCHQILVWKYLVCHVKGNSHSLNLALGHWQSVFGQASPLLS